MIFRKTVTAGAILGGLVLAAIHLGSARAQEQVPMAEHGAAAMDYQLQKLEELEPHGELDRIPDAFDPVVWSAFVPKDNETTPERVALGKKLYFDKRLSADGTVACATCHDVTRGFTDQRDVSEGIDGQLGHRNAPTTMNAVLFRTLFLDGRAASLEEQARLPIINPIEMGFETGEDAAEAIADDPEYQRMFESAYGRDVNYEDIGRAIAAFERTLIFVDSPFRRFLRGDEDAIPEEAKLGWKLYNGKARCNACHPINLSNPLGTDNRFHNVGVSARHQDFEALARRALAALEEDPSLQRLEELAVGTDLSELGRFMVTKNRSHIGSFRTLQVLNVGITQPYMHDGTMPTLWDVMDHYNKGGEPNPFLDGGMEPLALTEEEINQVVAFLFTLTDYRFAEENERQMKEQRELAAESRPFRDEAMAQRRVIQYEQRVNQSRQN